MSTAQQRFSTGTALVTGGAAGIGEGFVRHLAVLGMAVVVADIDEQKAVEVADAVIREGGAAEAYRIDVTDADAVDEMARYVFDRYSSVELLVNNAGVENAGLLWEVSIDRWRKVMDINVDGVFHCLRSFVPRMIETGTPACIANLSSVGGLNSVAVQAPYIVSKHAVLALTECLHQELSLVNAPIQVSAVLPHSIRSQIFLAAERDAPPERDCQCGLCRNATCQRRIGSRPRRCCRTHDRSRRTRRLLGVLQRRSVHTDGGYPRPATARAGTAGGPSCDAEQNGRVHSGVNRSISADR